MKKISLLLASIGAGLLLVGGTVAAYIVTSADTLGVRVSPGTIVNENQGHVTLSWGSNTTHPVENLVPGIETEVGQVKLAAQLNGEANNYAGAFTVSVENLALHSGLTSGDLMSYLTIKVYADTSGAGTYTTATTLPVADAVDGYYKTTQSFDAVAGYMYKVTVTLSTTAAENDELYNALKSQLAYASFNWGIRSGSEDIDSTSLATVYYATSALGEGEELYVYIYKDNKMAAIYPGVKMTYVYDIAGDKQLYSASFDRSKYDSFKFITHTSTTNTVRHEVTKAFATNETAPYYNGTAWAETPAEELAKYYVRGSISGVSYWSVNEKTLALAPNPDTVHKPNEYLIENLVLHANDEIKIYRPATKEAEEAWLGPSEGNYLITADGKYTVCFEYGHADGSSETGSWVNGMGVFKTGNLD